MNAFIKAFGAAVGAAFVLHSLKNRYRWADYNYEMRTLIGVAVSFNLASLFWDAVVLKSESII